MRLFDIDVQKLIEIIDQAKGNVYLITDDGNKLNLKSKLCQLYGVRMLLEQAKDAKISAELQMEYQEDEMLFLNYMMFKGQAPSDKK